MRLARVLTLMTGSMWIVGDARRALPVGLRAREVAYSVGELGPIVGANHTLGIVYTFLGRYEDAARLLSANVELIGSDRAREGFGRGIAVSVASRAWIAWSLSCVGRFDEAGTAAAVALDISGAIDQPWTTIAARWGAAFLSLVRGEFKAILPVLRETTALCEAAGIRIYHAAFLAGVGRACARTGMVDEGLAALREAAAAAAESNKVAECFTLWWLADAELMVRNIEAAQSIAMQAVDLARIREERGTLADALVALSDVHRERNDRATAVELLEEAMTLGRELGMRPTVAHCHARLARLYRTTGRGDAGGQHFVAARTMYREMGMTYWLEQVENEPTQLT